MYSSTSSCNSHTTRPFVRLGATESRDQSDYLNRKRQATLYKSMLNAVQKNNYQEKNQKGVPYNKSIGIKPCGNKQQSLEYPTSSTPETPSGKLATVDSYNTMIDMAKGKHYVNPRMGGLIGAKFTAACNQLMEVNYNGAQNIPIGNLTPLYASEELGVDGELVHLQVGIAPRIVPFRGIRFSPNVSNSIVDGVQIIPGGTHIKNNASANNQVNNPYKYKYDPQGYIEDGESPGYILDPSNLLLSPAPGLPRSMWWARYAIPAHHHHGTFWKAMSAAPLNGMAHRGWRKVNFSNDIIPGAIKSFMPQTTLNQNTNLIYAPKGPILPDQPGGLQERVWHEEYSGGVLSNDNTKFNNEDLLKFRQPGYQGFATRRGWCTGRGKID